MSETVTMTLTDFLLARIAEDEDVATQSRQHEHFDTRDATGLTWEQDDGYGAITVSSGRVLAECEAKRRIAEEHPPRQIDAYDADGIEHGGWFCDTCFDESFPCPTLCALALPYAAHPDYREEWRP